MVSTAGGKGGGRRAGRVRWEEGVEEEVKTQDGGTKQRLQTARGGSPLLPTSPSLPGGGGGGLERLHLVLFRTMRRSGGGSGTQAADWSMLAVCSLTWRMPSVQTPTPLSVIQSPDLVVVAC